jgi:predicted outer membrane protein
MTGMFSNARRITVGALAAAALSACASNLRTPEVVTTRTSTAAGTIPMTVNVPPLPESELSSLRMMTDANILQHMTMSDSLEIAMANVALQHTQRNSVRRLARTIIADHSRSLSTGRTIARQNDIPLQLAPGDTSGMHGYMMLDRLQNAGTDFDRIYLGSQIRLHRHMLAELEALRSSARSTPVRQHVLDDIEPVQRHLDQAQQIATSLGYTYAEP